MKVSTLTALAALIAHCRASDDELRERCAETTRSKFRALADDAETLANEEGVTEAAGPQVTVDTEALANAISERLGMEVASAVESGMSAHVSTFHPAA